MADEAIRSSCHQLEITLYDLPATTVRIDLPRESEARLILRSSTMGISVGAAYQQRPLGVAKLFIQPRRLLLDTINDLQVLPISIWIECGLPFISGSILVPARTQTSISTTMERIRVVGPSYWALPLDQGVTSPPQTAEGQGFSAGQQPAARSSGSRSPAVETSNPPKQDDRKAAP